MKRLRAFTSHAYATPQKYGKQDKRGLLTSLGRHSRRPFGASGAPHPLCNFVAPGLLLRVSTLFRFLPTTSSALRGSDRQMPQWWIKGTWTHGSAVYKAGHKGKQIVTTLNAASTTLQLCPLAFLYSYKSSIHAAFKKFKAHLLHYYDNFPKNSLLYRAHMNIFHILISIFIVVSVVTNSKLLHILASGNYAVHSGA